VVCGVSRVRKSEVQLHFPPTKRLVGLRVVSRFSLEACHTNLTPNPVLPVPAQHS